VNIERFYHLVYFRKDNQALFLETTMRIQHSIQGKRLEKEREAEFHQESKTKDSTEYSLSVPNDAFQTAETHLFSSTGFTRNYPLICQENFHELLLGLSFVSIVLVRVFY